MDNRLSKETLPYIPAPRLTPELIDFLEFNFPEKSASLGQDITEIFHQAGQRSVVKFLKRVYEEQNDNVR
jgi:hypothetical protein